MKRVIECKKLEWPFEDSIIPRPYVRVNVGKWGRRIDVDPFPCYTHSKKNIIRIVKDVELKFPIKFKTRYFLLHNEVTSRVNAMTYQEHDYSKEETPKPFTPFIVISGKRIPIHPAITRYLIPHEYGHVIEDWILYSQGITDGTTEANDFREEYAKMRKMEYSAKYGGSNWDTNVGEVIANDFRILVGNYEHEFWPHKGVKHPTQSKEAKKWWKDAVKKWAY